MKRRFFATFAVAILWTVLASASNAAQNQPDNWPSRSCGCSTAGKCYIAYRHPPKDDECLPDGDGGTACTGICSFTSQGPGSGSGGITRQNVPLGSNSLGNAQ